MIWGSGQVLGYHWEQRQDKSLGEILVTSKSFQIQNMFFLSVKQRCNTEELPEFLPQREFQKKSEKNFVCTENLQLHVTFSSFVYLHSFCCSSWTFKNWWVLKKMHKIAISLSVCGLDRIEGLWNQVQFEPLDFKRSKDGRSAYLVFILGNRVTLHAVYWRAPASSVALCDVLGGEQEEDNLFRWKLGRLGTWVSSYVWKEW